MCNLGRGERFKDARLEHNKNGKQTMEQVYAATGISQSMIKDLEDDDKDRSVGYDKIVTLAKHYGVSSDYLLGLTNDPSTSPCATDELGLSPQAIQWLLHLAKVEGPLSSKYLSILLESESFQSLILLLIQYFSALNADSIGANILQDHTSKSPTLYANQSTYLNKLKAAANDQQYDETTRMYLSAFSGFEHSFLFSGLSSVLDSENDNNIIHLLDIVELKIRRNLESTLQSIKEHHEHQSV